MKKFRKLSGIMLTVAMTAMMTSPVFAASITIENAVVDKEYTAYKIFDYTETTVDDKTIRAYNMDDDTYDVWGSIVENFEYNSTKIFTSTAVTENGEITHYFNVNSLFTGDDSAIAIAFSEYLKNNIPDDLGESTKYPGKLDSEKETYTEPQADLTLSNDAEPGYYFIDTSVGALLMLNHISDSATILEKNDLPDVSSKSVRLSGEDNWTDLNSVSSGDMVEFQIIVDVKKGNNQAITVHDEMGVGFALDPTTIKLQAGASGTSQEVGNEVDEDGFYYTTTNLGEGETCDFHLILTENYVKGLAEDADIALTITYEAKVTDRINEDGAGNNNAKVTYGGTDVPGEETDSYTATFKVKKVDGTNQGALSGAKFRLYRDASGEDEVYLRNVKDSKNDPTTEWIADTDANSGEVIVTDATGQITIKNIATGTYYLKEVEAPAGYNRLTYMIPIMITDYEKDEVSGDIIPGGEIQADLDGADLDGKIEYVTMTDGIIMVANKQGTILPSTGGIGTTVFYAAGIILMAGAVFFVVRRKRA